MAQTTLAIIGGGIAGLSAAYYAQQEGIDYVLIEASSRWGGKIHTEMIDTAEGQILVEWGPDSFITQKPWALQLAHELGLDAELLGTNDAQRQTYVLDNGQLKTLPDGMMLIIPTKFAPFALSTLISPLAKMRMGLESLIPARKDDSDESLAEFIRRRLGQEALDKLAEPLMSGIYNADAETQSVLATFPRFRTIEQQYGSLTRGMLAAKKKRPPGKSKTSMFMSFDKGMQTLVDALVGVLDGELVLNTRVERLQQRFGAYDMFLNDGQHITAQQILLTTPAYMSGHLLKDLTPEAAHHLQAIQYVDAGTVSLAYRKDDISRLPDGFGVVIPKSEKRQINAVTVSSTKFAYRAPDEMILLRVFFGGARTPQTWSLSDESLLETVQAELGAIYGIYAEPVMTRIARSKQATPQYHVGHLEGLDTMENYLPDGVRVTGSAYRGIGVPDCIHQSKQVVAEIASQLHLEPEPVM